MNFSEALHHSFTDFPFLIPEMLCRWLGMRSLCDPVHFAEAVVELTAHFLKSYYEDPHGVLDLLTYGNIVTVGAKFASQTTFTS